MNAVWIDGVLCYKIVCGGTTQLDFIRFLTRQLINVMQPYPGQCSVLLLDNVALHKTPLLRQIADAIKFKILWLPRYCPLFNLAEYSFRDVKSIEKSKGIIGEREAMHSLIDSVERLRHKDYSKDVHKMGYLC